LEEGCKRNRVVIKLEERIESDKAERSLLMSFCASLPFVEQNLLDHLQQAGSGQVTVLIDEKDYQASLSDFVMGAGIRYRIHPVRLSRASANFHPKLFLLLSQKSVRLLIASANLTPSGFRSNLEIVDELCFPGNGEPEGRGLTQYANMLKSLVQLDKT